MNISITMENHTQYVYLPFINFYQNLVYLKCDISSLNVEFHFLSMNSIVYTG